ncbi:hypothetical protein M422DRAFT_255428 [Sphaerobolus stellatus SS14]|uniref:Uncharacterized protein n=1 Tax=Sphaerobolus stellatus (strain SS14) TaxID=990650 RepID=A0A0C9VST1_SPHS4|nr:hypothetical protein M422DRAFT_255428 [Sphaerobolus stellatus SS14]
MATFLAPFVKGYAFSDAKLASKFKFDPSDRGKANICVDAILKTALPDDAYVSVTPGYLDDKQEIVAVIILDDDFDKERLQKKPLPPLDPSIERIMEVLDGPGVWEKL